MNWNTQWMIYLFAKTIYHLIVCWQLLYKSKQRELCHKLGLLRELGSAGSARIANEMELP